MVDKLSEKEKQKGKQSKEVRIYLDTNIIRDWIKYRNNNSAEVLLKIREQKWSCVTSVFTFMEILDIEKDDVFFHKKVRQGWDINKIIRGRTSKELTDTELEECIEPLTIFSKEKFVTLLELDQEGWNTALGASMNSTLSSADAVHFAVAYESGCSLIITNDDDFIKQAEKLLKEGKYWEKEMRICLPNKAFKNLEEMGIKAN